MMTTRISAGQGNVGYGNLSQDSATNSSISSSSVDPTFFNVPGGLVVHPEVKVLRRGSPRVSHQRAISSHGDVTKRVDLHYE